MKATFVPSDADILDSVQDLIDMGLRPTLLNVDGVRRNGQCALSPATPLIYSADAEVLELCDLPERTSTEALSGWRVSVGL